MKDRKNAQAREKMMNRKKGIPIMFDFASMRNYDYENKTSLDRWMQDEKVAFCEDSGAFGGEKNESLIARFFVSLFSALVK